MTQAITTISGVRAYIDNNNIAWLNAEDVARGLGFVEVKKDRVATNGDKYAAVRWSRVNEYLADFGFANKVAKDDFIPENIFYRLAMKANNSAALKFQSLVADEILPTIRKTGAYVYKPATPNADAVYDIGQMAEQIQSIFAVKRGIALSQAIDAVSSIRGINLQNLKQLLPPADHLTGFLNASDLGKKFDINAKQVNHLLCKAKLQEKYGNDWRITDDGKSYGEEFPFSRNGHSGYHIKWNETVIKVIDDFLH